MRCYALTVLVVALLAATPWLIPYSFGNVAVVSALWLGPPGWAAAAVLVVVGDVVGVLELAPRLAPALLLAWALIEAAFAVSGGLLRSICPTE